jgi:hypothetical protein
MSVAALRVCVSTGRLIYVLAFVAATVFCLGIAVVWALSYGPL